MATGFDAQNPPFDRLTQPEAEELRAAADIGYFAPGEVIIARGAAADVLHVVIKGAVEARDGDALQGVLGPRDSFDSRALVHGAAGEDFLAAEETLCFLLPGALVRKLIARNPAFAAFFYADVSRKLEAFAEARLPEGGMESVLRARVRDAMRHRAEFIDADATIEQAGAAMAAADVNALFVRRGAETGVVTGMNLAKAAILRRMSLSTPVGAVTNFEIVAVAHDDLLLDALLAMTRHNKRRLAVRDGEGFVGFLEDIDLLGRFAGNSQLVPRRIDAARDVAELAEPARAIQDQVERLWRQGVKVEVIAEVTSDLNRRLFVRLFDLVAPESIRAQGCLILMGSEGRAEQTVRTDQDNGLLLGAEVPEADLVAFRDVFSGALDSFGFPPCPGNVMVRNPLWSQTASGMERQLRHWIEARTPEAAMNIAIFLDAVALTGRVGLLDETKGALLRMMRGEAALMAHFAHLIDSFATPSLGVLNTLMTTVGVGEDAIDIKKAGIFPIVHGIRTMALDRGIAVTPTAARIAALVAGGALQAELGRDLLGALRVFMAYRIATQIEAVRRGSVEEEALVRPSRLTAADRDILRDSLRVVRVFREVVATRFKTSVF
jgi:CBS domain-containing protein